MIKANDLNMNLAYFETSKTWEYGEYKLLSSDIHNFGARNADGSIDLVKAQRILDVQVAKALNIIKRDLDVKRILTIFSWADLVNTRFVEGLLQVIEQQLSGMITDGNKEIKQGKNYSGSGVDVSTDISGFLTSGDRLYKATEDQWYAWQLDKYSIEYDEVNNTYTLIDNAHGTVKQIIGTISLTAAQLQEISEDFKKLVLNDAVLQALLKGTPGAPGKDGTPGKGIDWLTDNYANLQEFANNAPDYEVVRYNINKDGTNNKKGFVWLIKTPAGLFEAKTWEEIKEYIDSGLLLKADLVDIQSDSFEAIKKINDFSFGQNNNGGPISYSEHFGDLDDQAQRTNFMNNVKIGNWYTFNIGGNHYQAAIVSGDKTTNFIWAGKRIVDGANGKTTEFVAGSTSATGHSETAGSFTGDAFSPSIALPDAYAPTQYMPTDAIKQLILDNNLTLANDETDPTWQDLDGTQTTTFTPQQITVDIDGSGLGITDTIQFLLGSTVGNLVLDGSIKIYDNVADAARNGHVAGQYKWYVYKVSDTVNKFVMEDSKGTLTDTGQNIAKYRRVSPTIQKFTAHYTSQADILKGSIDISGVNKGASQTITLPAGLTIDKLTGISLTVSGSTDWYKIEGWDKVTAFYISVSNEASNQIWWVEYKIEAVSGDKTKLKVTNFKSGNVGTDNASYNAHWIAFKGGK